MRTFDDQLDALARHVADLAGAPAAVWQAVALPLAAAINALDGGEEPFADEHDHPVLLARQLDRARRRRRTLASAS